MGTAAYSLTGFGIQTAAVRAGGYPAMTNTEEYDGSSWTAVNAMPAGRGELGGFGILTAGVIFGGGPPYPAGGTNTSYEYDGTNWSSGGTVPYPSRSEPGGAGTLTAGLAMGGTTAPNTLTN